MHLRHNQNARFNHTLGVIAHTVHWIGPDGTPWSYEPYVREMRIWSDLFAFINICSPVGEGPMEGHQAPYLRENLRWHPVRYASACGYRAAFSRLTQLPGLTRAARKTIKENDFILLRSPGHFGLVGAALVRLMRRPSLTKWAGENGPYKGERIPSRVERVLQSKPNSLHPVLVYGDEKKPHQVSFMPALMTAEELDQARVLSSSKSWNGSFRMLSVGVLEPVKGFDLAVKALGQLRVAHAELNWTYTVIGDGSMRRDLEALAYETGIGDRTVFMGALPFSEVQKHYAASHLAIMPGTKEGWPKVIAEAWAHGTIPVASAAGIVPSILKDENAGVTFDPTPAALASTLYRLASARDRMQEISQSLRRKAEQMSLDSFRANLEKVLIERCGLT